MNEAFCNLCQPLFEGAAAKADWRRTGEREVLAITGPHRHHQLARDLRECAQTRCILCAAIWNSMPRSRQKRWLRTDSRVPQSKAQLGLEVTLERLRLCEEGGDMVIRMKYSAAAEDLFHTIMLEQFDRTDTHEGLLAPLPVFQPQVEPASAPSSESLQWAKEMLADCEAQHEQCKVTAVWLPTRLIHLGQPSQMPRLVETSEMLLETCSPPPRYTTLSHCWGKIHPLKLTSENIPQFYNEIRQDIIPKTFADAMTVTRLLGVEYIWIDSLCIIQGDSKDWEHEVARMADVYRHGYCNMAALEATDSSLDFLYRQNSARLSPVLVESRWEHQERTLWVRRPHGSEVTRDIEASPVHRRAWVLQERLLSPRILHFGQGIMYWECRKLIAPEAGEASEVVFMNPELGNLGSYYREPSPHKVPEDEIYDIHYLVRLWAGIVARYTRARLTYQSDRFVAISAVARDIHQMLSDGVGGEVKYLAGLWSVLIERELLWLSASPRRTATPLSPTDGVTAPSWSWASFNGPAIPSDADDLTTTTLVAHVTGHTLVPGMSGDPFFGPAAASKCVLEIKGLCWRLADDWARDHRSVRGQVSMTLSWDATDRSSALNNATSFLLPVVIDNTVEFMPMGHMPRADLLGLIIRRVEHTTATSSFRRVGTFVLCSSSKPEDFIKSDGLEGEGSQALFDRYIELGLENGTFWPCQFDHQPEQNAATGPDIWAKATTNQTIYLE